jgi:hypothetical protein
MVDGTQQADRSAGVAHPSGRAGRYAVLRVHDVDLVRDGGQSEFEGVDRQGHPFLQGVRSRRGRDDVARRGQVPEEALAGVAERDHPH